jgi:hypothetical protein
MDTTKKVTKRRKVRRTKTTGKTDADSSESNKKIKIKKQSAIKAVVEKEKNFFTFSRNKTTGNYSIYDRSAKRIQFFIKNIKLPFGAETYNNSDIVNISIGDTDNFHHNTLTMLRELDHRLDDLPNTNTYIDLEGLEYHRLLKENRYTNKKGEEILQHQLRTYLKRGVKITHARYFGMVDKKDLAGKECDINLELGSLWTNDDTGKYGCTVYISSIKVLN